MGLVKRLKAAYDVCVGSEEIAQAEREVIHFYLAVRSIVYKLTKGDAPDTAQMNQKVRELIAEALKAEGVEEIFALGEDKAETIYEISDLAYHVLVLMVQAGITVEEITRELEKRHVIDHKVKQERMQ